MNVATEGDVGMGCHEAPPGICGRADITPSLGLAGFGMHVEPIVFLPRQRQFRKKSSLGRAQPAARPFDRGLRFRIHGFR